MTQMSKGIAWFSCHCSNFEQGKKPTCLSEAPEQQLHHPAGRLSPLALTAGNIADRR